MKVLTENHPFYKKIDKLMEYMSANNIGISFMGSNTVCTNTITNEEFFISDKENFNSSVTTFPYPYEFKLISE